MMSQRKCWTACSANSASANSSSLKNFFNIMVPLGSCAQLAGKLEAIAQWVDGSVATSTARSNKHI